MKRSLVAIALAGTTVLGLAGPASAAHNGNNKAQLAGDGASGTAVVNDSKGTGTFNGNTRVTGLDEGSDTFRVNLAGANPQEICSFEADGMGTDGCSENRLPLAGFSRAEIVDESGAVVASGTFRASRQLP